MGCHFLLQGNLPDPGIEPTSPASQTSSLLSEPPENSRANKELDSADPGTGRQADLDPSWSRVHRSHWEVSDSAQGKMASRWDPLWGKRVPSSCHSWQLRGIKALIASESRCCRWSGSFQYRESWPRESEQLLRQEECMGHNRVCSLLSWQNCQNSYSLPPGGIRGLLIRMGASQLVSVLQGGQNLILWLSALLFSRGSDSKELFCDAGDLSSIPGSGRSPAGGNGNPL